MEFWIRVVFVLTQCIVVLSNQCVLRDGECSYNVYLSNNNCDRPLQKGDANIQKDSYTVAGMQRDFNVVKVNHEDRIRELEASIQKLLRSSIPARDGVFSSGQALEGPVNIENYFPGVQTAEGGLLSSLHNHFTNLRNEIEAKANKVTDMEIRLNDTTVALQQAHDELFKNSQKVIAAENQVREMVQERYVLKNQIKFKSEQLAQAMEKVNYTDARVLQLENQLYVLVRSESNLKEELGLYQWKLNNSLKAFKNLKGNHTKLERTLNKTQTELERANLDLMECITAKTQSFCGFENDDMCGFTQETEKDQFDWTRSKGETPSSNTGPSGDHTCRAKGAGHFLYVEASGRGNNERAVMYSPFYQSLDQLCLGFYYHMYGRQIGTLNVYTKTRSGDVIEAAWRAYGNQGNVWIQALLDIPKKLARAGFQLVFEATMTGSYLGDIAIDDISVSDGRCGSDSVIPVSVHSNVTLERSAQLRRLQKFKKFRKMLRRRRNDNSDS